jgi:hypothetical protein
MNITALSSAIPPVVIYDLYHRPRGKRPWLRLKDRGIQLADDRIGWTSAGVSHEESLSDITSVHLLGPPSAGSCEITFNDGTGLFVLGCDEAGEPNEQQAECYRNFVTGLHRRLLASAAATIEFSAGFPQSRYATAWILLILVWMVVIAGFLALILNPHSIIENSFISIVGLIGLFNLFYFNKFHLFIPRLLKNAPRTYDPAHIPVEMMP